MSFLSGLFGGGSEAANATALEAQKVAKQQRVAERDRQDRVRKGQAGIDTAFSQFDPAYYDKFKQSYGDFYLPQIQEQYAKAKDKLTAVLAGRGMLESSVGAQKFADTERTRADAAATIGNQGADAANQLKAKVEAAKTNLYGINTGVSDPALLASQATGQAATFAAPPALSPIGQVFASTLQGFGQINKADANSMNPQMPWNTYSAAPISGRGSSIG
jgi:hypothetical protein